MTMPSKKRDPRADRPPPADALMTPQQEADLLARAAEVTVPENGATRLMIPAEEGKSRDDLLAELTLSTIGRNALSSVAFANRGQGGAAKYLPSAVVVGKLCAAVRDGEMDPLTDMLTAQAMTLDCMFSEFTRLAVENLSAGHVEASQIFANLGVKAQVQCRVTVETLARVKRGGKQHIQITHVHQGGQAVVAETVNNNRSDHGRQIEQDAESAALAALSGQDPPRLAVPMPGHEGQEAMPIAWREGDRTPARE